MISHKHKCIFIHISKCAGSSIERSFGIDTSDNTVKNHLNLFGWCNKNNIYLQHATPEQLLDLGYITKEQWNSYYKFIVVRNPWSRALSDYLWISNNYRLKDTFTNFIKAKGKYKKILTESNSPIYRGDHLYSQKSYFFVHGKEIIYDKVVKLENYREDILDLKLDQELIQKFLVSKSNIGKKKLNHYSFFYNHKRRKLLEKFYGADIKYLKYEFEDLKSMPQRLKSNFNSKSFLE
ncbi:sulfotransferase family 2 domain-containing protein [Mangrovimonas aestuarii]|uniref:sulfotransferase family 2 domain-containing protein n=1 Tax=Mangrovimonas aestuarii TaxID=3018443 RepID=UPI002378B7A8|nr:sulfotransferase family 2 domain-containing protein [Mangrovimonas aestuarii]